MLGQKFCSVTGAGLLVATLLTAACGGGGGGGSGGASTPVPPTYTVGGTITGLTGSGLKLSLVVTDGSSGGPRTQTVTVASGATTFTFPTAIAAPASSSVGTFYEASVTAQPADSANTQTQTCLATNAYGAIHAAANITNIQVTCTANTSSPLQGVYQVTRGGSPQLSWIAFSSDGTYIFASIQNNATCAQNGNGVDYGSYNWNSATGALQIQSALVYSLAPCGFTNATGIVNSAPNTLVRTGSGALAVLQATGASGGIGSTLVPVASVPGTIVGAFTFGPSLTQGVYIFGNDGHYVNINPQTDSFTGEVAGLEYGCYSVSGGSITADTSSACSGAVLTSGAAGFTGDSNGAATGTATVNFTIPDANTLTWSFAGYANYPSTMNRFVPTSAAGCCSPVTTGATIGGTVTGLTTSTTPLALQLFTVAADGSTSVQSIAVPPGATTFTFPNAIPIPASAATATYFEVMVGGEPSGASATCVPTNAYGQIAAAGNITSVVVACTATPTSPLQGVYQFYSDAAGTQPLQKWLAFAQDGTYIYGDVENNSACNESGNGVDYGAYNWNATTGVLTFETAAVYSLAPCGITNGAGVVDTSVTRTLTRSGTGAATVLTLTTTGGSLGTVYLLPVSATPGTIVGAFDIGSSLDQGVVVFFPVASGQTLGRYLVLNPQTDPTTNTGYVAGLEYGCYSVANGQLTVDTTVADCSSTIFTAGTGGLSAGVATTYAVPYAVANGGAKLTLIFTPYNYVYSSLQPN